MERARFKVEGMSRGHCAAVVKKALNGVPGVRRVDVSLEPPEAVVEFDPEKATEPDLIKVMADEGYTSSAD